MGFFTHSSDSQHFLAIEPGLPFSAQPRLLRGIFGIVLISVIMSMFEIFFYLVIVKPKTEEEINDLLESLKVDIPDIELPEGADNPFPFSLPDFLPVKLSSPADFMNALLAALAVDERKQIDKLNSRAFMSMGVFVMFLTGFLWVIYDKLRWENSVDHKVLIFGGELSVTFASSALTVFALVIFQYIF